jgi:hypothetical protein
MSNFFHMNRVPFGTLKERAMAKNAPIGEKPPPSDGGPNTLGNERGKEKQDNEGQQGGQYGGSQGAERSKANPK